MKKIVSLLTLFVFTGYSDYASDNDNASILETFYADTDSDGYGDPDISLTGTWPPPPGYTWNNQDCNDSDGSIHPGATELCNGIDDDCDGLIDTNELEYCNGIDDNCNGLIDTDDPGVLLINYYVDYDEDGYANGVIIIAGCTPPFGWSEAGGSGFEMYDADWLYSDPATETCNGVDDDGNGLIDEEDPSTFPAQIPWYADMDGDGYGNLQVFVLATCSPPEGYLPWPNHVDCDDTNPAVWENCDGVDTDCDGVPDNLDVCPGGDDSIDNNDDGIADCSQLLNYNDYSPDWQCANNKIYVCHNDNNPQTICIDANALLPAHYNHGDIIGPCTSCPQNLIAPDNPESGEVAFQSIVAEQSHAPVNDGGHPNFDQANGNDVLFAMPNPADDHIEVQTTLSQAVITVLNVSGKVVIRQAESGDNNIINTGELTNGIYFLRIQNGVDCYTRSIVVMH